eukprot:TRINITY_DN61395_c0_g1_i1.p1 TRINITY_DN61395_c0_g1~~TRINITY_DN61395_c0_g1_i1.p1  ORF type:complete len:470 (-),score=100.83 TRINITY_DN61395_c0_g1_i1:40-1449(-)
MAAAVSHAIKKRNEAEERLKTLQTSAAADGREIQALASETDTTWLPSRDQTGFFKFQRAAAELYLNLKVQMFVAGLIGGNFLCNIAEEWVDPSGLKQATAWDVLDYLFNVLFLIELILNMYGFWFRQFWSSGWNIFDFIVVSIGVLNMCKVPLPGPFGLLRMMRAFRVFRLFKRVKSLNKILQSLIRAVPAHFNAFFILFLVLCIYAIVGVELFMDHAKDGYYLNELGDRVDIVTGRGLMYGKEYFGNFGLSAWTMFQTLTGDSWCEAVARPMIHTSDPLLAFGTVVFFVTFQLIVGMVLQNVVIAVLLEKMVEDPSVERRVQALEDAEEQEQLRQEAEAATWSLELQTAEDGQASEQVFEPDCEAYCQNSLRSLAGQLSSPHSLATALTCTPGSSGSSGSSVSVVQEEETISLATVLSMESDLRMLKTEVSLVNRQMEALLAQVRKRTSPAPSPSRSASAQAEAEDLT